MLMQKLSVPTLTRTEWKVVSIAIQDALARSCGASGPKGKFRRRLSAIYRSLTGIEPRRPLADRRLEALRRFVCATQRSGRVDDVLVEPLVELGFTRAQIDAIAMLTA